MPEQVDAAGPTPDDATNRVHIGNLAFKTKYQDLKAFLAGYNATSVTMPKTKTTRTNGTEVHRRLGYAFVGFASKEDADRAVAELNEQTLDDRKITVSEATSTAVRKPRAPRPKKTASGDAAEATDSAEPKEPKEPKADKKAKARRPRGPDSLDTVFVANLPVDTVAEELTELFADLSPVEVNLAAKRARSIRRKGEVIQQPARTLAFVKFADEATRQRAIDEFDGKTFKDVELQVRVATERVDEEPEPESTDAPDAEAAPEAAPEAAEATEETAPEAEVETEAEAAPSEE